MARLTIVVEVPDADPTLEDPHEVAEELLDTDHRGLSSSDAPSFVGAEWGDHLPEPESGMKPCVRPTCDAPEVELAVDPPELIRRAYDEAQGRRGRRCASDAHRARVAQLCQLGAARLREKLIALEVRIDPPLRERVCTCEEG
jgi:hypothetical protein